MHHVSNFNIKGQLGDKSLLMILFFFFTAVPLLTFEHDHLLLSERMIHAFSEKS